MEDRKPAHAGTSTRPHRHLRQVLEVYEIRDLDGNELKLPLTVRSKVLQAWESQRETGVPHYHVVREDLALIIRMGQNQRLQKATKEGFEEALRLVASLPKHPSGADASQIGHAMRATGYQLLIQREDGTWRVLREERKLMKFGRLHLVFLRLALGELTIGKPRDAELQSGHGRILERAQRERDEQRASHRRPRRHQPTRADRAASKAAVAVQAEQLAQVAALEQLQTYVGEHYGYVIRFEAVRYDKEAEVDPRKIRFLVSPERICGHITLLADQGRWVTIDELVWSLVKARVPVTGDVFQKARKRYSRLRRLAETELERRGYRRGHRHGAMEPVAFSGHKSKVIHWVRQGAP